MKDWIAIVNPNAGGGKCGKDWPVIRKLLIENNINFNFVLSERKFHSMVISREMIRKGHKNILVIGGDGTLNEVINGIFGQKDINTNNITIGMIPVGTGNDWARMFSIPSDYNNAIKILKQENSFTQDVGRAIFTRNNKQHGRYFVNIAGLGFDAHVCQKTNTLKENGKSNKILYLWSILSGLFSYHHRKASVCVDGEIKKCNIFSMNIGICQYSGGGMKQVPNAIPDDGIFDLTIIKKIGKIDIIRSLPKLYNGTIHKHSKVISMNGKNIQIESNKKIYLETDGESLGHTPIQINIIPRSINIIRAS